MIQLILGGNRKRNPIIAHKYSSTIYEEIQIVEYSKADIASTRLQKTISNHTKWYSIMIIWLLIV